MSKTPMKRGSSFSLDDAKDLRRQAGEIETQNRIGKVAKCLKDNPLLLPIAERALTEAGADLSADLEPEESPLPKKARPAPSNLGAGSQLPKCEVYFGMISSGNMQHILGALEPFFTPEYISRLRPSARRAIPKPSLMQLMEFLTGMRADTWIGTNGPLKSFDSSMCALNNLRGRRGRELRLPPSWPLDGVYRVYVSDEGQICIQHKFIEQKKHAIALLPQDFLRIVKFPHQLSLEKNYSEMDALLVKVSALFGELVTENVLGLIGVHPENSCEPLPRPSMENSLTELLEAEHFTKSAPSLPLLEFAAAQQDGSDACSASIGDSSVWHTSDISTDGSQQNIQEPSPEAPQPLGPMSAAEESAHETDADQPVEQEIAPTQVSTQQQPLVVDESLLQLS